MTAVPDGELETALEMMAALRSGAVTSGELVERATARAETWQPSILAFSQLWPEPEVADPDGPFAGVPVAIKELFDVAGRETTGCCRAYAGRFAERDAPAVTALRSAGLAIIGKTNQHELALGGTNRYSACGRPGNPWDPARLTGGSSGGSAAAVAAGIVPFALGSDTGGSIRIPSSFCGTFGLKVTTGSITIDGMLPLAPSLDTPGPLAATVGDLRALYRVLAGRSDGARVEPVPPDARGVRLGLVGGYFAQHVHPAVAAGVERVCADLEAAGAAVDPVDGTGIDDSRAVWRAICFAEFAGAHPSLSDRLGVVLDPAVVSSYRAGMVMSQDERAAAAARRGAIRRWFDERLRGRDALVVPTTGYPAPHPDTKELSLGPAGSIDLERVAPGWFTCPVNLSGLPALTVPAGRSPEGMPFGVTMIGPAGSEERLLGFAALWEASTGYRPARPAPGMG